MPTACRAGVVPRSHVGVAVAVGLQDDTYEQSTGLMGTFAPGGSTFPESPGVREAVETPIASAAAGPTDAAVTDAAVTDAAATDAAVTDAAVTDAAVTDAAVTDETSPLPLLPSPVASSHVMSRADDEGAAAVVADTDADAPRTPAHFTSNPPRGT